MPAGSKMDPSLAKAELISHGGSTSMITYLKRGGGETPAKQQQGRGMRLCEKKGRGVRLCERNNSADTKVSEGGG